MAGYPVRSLDRSKALSRFLRITKPYSKNQLAEVIGRVLKQPAQ